MCLSSEKPHELQPNFGLGKAWSSNNNDHAKNDISGCKGCFSFTGSIPTEDRWIKLRPELRTHASDDDDGGEICGGCGRVGHSLEHCFILHPELPHLKWGHIRISPETAPGAGPRAGAQERTHLCPYCR